MATFKLLKNLSAKRMKGLKPASAEEAYKKHVAQENWNVFLQMRLSVPTLNLQGCS